MQEKVFFVFWGSPNLSLDFYYKNYALQPNKFKYNQQFGTAFYYTQDVSFLMQSRQANLVKKFDENKGVYQIVFGIVIAGNCLEYDKDEDR